MPPAAKTLGTSKASRSWVSLDVSCSRGQRIIFSSKDRAAKPRPYSGRKQIGDQPMPFLSGKQSGGLKHKRTATGVATCARKRSLCVLLALLFAFRGKPVCIIPYYG